MTKSVFLGAITATAMMISSVAYADNHDCNNENDISEDDCVPAALAGSSAGLAAFGSAGPAALAAVGFVGAALAVGGGGSGDDSTPVTPLTAN